MKFEEIVKGERWQGYNKSMEYREQYLKLLTDISVFNEDGKSISEANLKSYSPRENEQLFEQRILQFKNPIPEVLQQIRNVFEKIYKTDGVYKSLDSEKSEQLATVKKILPTIYGEVEDYVVNYIIDEIDNLIWDDPNALILIQQELLGGTMVGVTPIIYESTKVLDKVYTKGVLTEATILDTSLVRFADGEREVNVFVRHTKYDVTIISDMKYFEQNGIEYEKIEISNKVYGIHTYGHNMGFMPLVQIGYEKDFSIKGLYVSPYHYKCLNTISLLMKVSSELQLSLTLHNFPQKVTYYYPCTEVGCHGGKKDDGNICNSCGGSGKKAEYKNSKNVHTTSQDVLEIPLIGNVEDWGKLPNVNSLFTYIQTPTEVVRFQKEVEDFLKGQIFSQMFNNEILQKQTSIQKTATEVSQSFEFINDTLKPYASNISKIYTGVVNSVISLLGFSKNDFQVYYIFPNDFKTKSLTQYAQDLKIVEESGAPAHVKLGLGRDIMKSYYIDSDFELKKYDYKMQHKPFAGNSLNEAIYLLNSPLVPQTTKELYCNFEQVFSIIDNTPKYNSIDGFYSKNFMEREKIIKNILSEIVAGITPIVEPITPIA